MILASAIMLTLSSTVVSADANKGKKLYMKKLNKACSMNGAAMAGKHTQSQWMRIQESGTLTQEIKTICPKVKDKRNKERDIVKM